MILGPTGIAAPLCGPRHRRSLLTPHRQPNPGATLLSGILEYWTSHEQSGIGVGVLGSWSYPVGTLAPAVGPDGSLCRSFGVGGSTSYLYSGSGSFWARGDTDYTFLCWVRLDSATYPYPLTFEDGSAYPFAALQVGPAATCFYTSPNGVNSYYAWHPIATSMGQWRMLVGRHDSVANTLSISEDGGASGLSVAYSLGGKAGGTGRVQIGGARGAYGRACTVQRAGIWTRCITAAEESWLYNFGRGRDYPFL